MVLELYTDESPGLKVDPVVVLVLSIVFIFSVVALHGMLGRIFQQMNNILIHNSYRKGYASLLQLEGDQRRRLSFLSLCIWVLFDAWHLGLGAGCTRTDTTRIWTQIVAAHLRKEMKQQTIRPAHASR